ncbi:MAG: subtilisin family serine protease [Phenylobacterium sp.]|jgi:subtilisin family serine protease
MMLKKSTLLSLSVVSFAVSLGLNAAVAAPAKAAPSLLPSPQLQVLNAPLAIAGLNAANVIADEYIVVFKDNASAKTIKQISQRITKSNQLDQSYALDNKPLRRFSQINGFSGHITAAQLKQLAQNPAVKSIEANRELSLAFTTSSATAGSWGTDRLDQQQLPLSSTYSPAGNGSGVHAYVIDTGINTAHNDFAGRAVWDFTSSDVSDGNDDENGHGTHMAGTVGSNTYGVAPGATLHAVKVLDGTGNGSLAGLIEGIEYVTANHQSPAVAAIGISTSFSAALNDAIAASTAAGVSYAVPTGDYSQQACSFSPASAPSALTVAASRANDDASPYSNSGACVDIYAPGLYIKSLWHTTNNANNTISHSPMAAAHVAGAAAVIRGNDVTCTVEQVSTKLLSQARSGTLLNVPFNTPNLLLGVPTVADAADTSCNGAVANTITPFDNAPTFALESGATVIDTWSYNANFLDSMVNTSRNSIAGLDFVSTGHHIHHQDMAVDPADSIDYLSIFPGTFTLTLDDPSYALGFHSYIQSPFAVTTVTVTLASGHTESFDFNAADTYIGFVTTTDPIKQLELVVPEGLEMVYLAR